MPTAQQLPGRREVRERERVARELVEALERLESAAARLGERAPEARQAFLITSETEGRRQLVVVGTQDQEVETTTPATPASQRSIAFDSSSQAIATFGSALEVELAGGDRIRISVGGVSASLDDIAQLLNDDAQNGGDITASVVEDGVQFRLLVETTATGAAATLTVTEDDFTDPTFQSFSLIDGALAEAGSDEVVTSETVQVPVYEARGVQRRVETTTEIDLPDLVLQATLQSFVSSYNDLRESVDEASSLGSPGLDAVAAQADHVLAEIGSVLDLEGGEAGLAVDEDGRAQVDVAALQRSVRTDLADLDAALRDTRGGVAPEVSRILERFGQFEAPRATPGFLDVLRDFDHGSRGRF